MHGAPVINDTQKIVVVIEQAYLVTCRCQYLLWKKSLQHENKIESLFTYLKPYKLSVGAAPYTCILKTRKQAREFVKSEEYNIIKEKVYSFLKPYDEYDVLKPDDVRIFVDYEAHTWEIPMHGRWVGDMNYSDMEKYMRSL